MHRVCQADLIWSVFIWLFTHPKRISKSPYFPYRFSKKPPISESTFLYAMGLLGDLCSFPLDCLSRHVLNCIGFIVGGLAVCFIYCFSFTGFLAVIAYLSFQMNFTINSVLGKKYTPHMIFCCVKWNVFMLKNMVYLSFVQVNFYIFHKVILIDILSVQGCGLVHLCIHIICTITRLITCFLDRRINGWNVATNVRCRVELVNKFAINTCIVFLLYLKK